jgi:hypothetical protein
MQYSAAQNIVPISKEPKLTPDEEPEDKGAPEEGGEPELKGEPEVKGEDEGQTGKGEGKPETPTEDDITNKDDETKSEDQPEPTDPRKGVPGSLDIANTTQQTLPPAYKIKIIFDAIKGRGIGNPNDCVNWDFGIYVQGKLVRLSDMNQPLKLCGDTIIQLKDKEATVEIPRESVESVKDYQPLSIFTAGSWLHNCNPEPLPTDLPEVRKALADKGSNIKEEIHKIQMQISNGCVPKTWTNPFNCIHIAGQYVCQSGTANKSLAVVNYVFESPGYGKFVPEKTVGNPESAQINTCERLPREPYTTTSDFCLYYTIQCPLCSAVRVHF